MTIKLNIKESMVGKKTYKIVETHYNSAVAILNIKQDHMLLTNKFRTVVNTDSWEIPGGLINKEGMSARNVAVGKIMETTGKEINAVDLEITTHYFPIIGSIKHKVYIWKAVVKDMLSEVKNDEVIEAKWFTFDEIEDMVNTSGIVDGKTITAFYKIAYENLKKL